MVDLNIYSMDLVKRSSPIEFVVPLGLIPLELSLASSLVFAAVDIRISNASIVFAPIVVMTSQISPTARADVVFSPRGVFGL